MKRLIMNDLIAWKNSPARKPLLLQGARQVGKTWIMKEFGKNEFDHVAYINFDENPSLQTMFDRNYSTERILLEINAATGVPIEPEKTLIVFDEVQEAPRAISSLKYFCENAREYAVIASGSYMGIALHAGISYPVGKVDLMTMYPMNYREFLLANGKENLLNALDQGDYDIISLLHDEYIDWLKRYLFIGGMPEAVDKFINSHDFNSVRAVQNSILAMYKTDFGKYATKSEIEKLNIVWDSIIVQLSKDNKKYIFADVSEGGRAKTYEEAIQWLYDNGLVYKLNNVSAPRMPLIAYTVFNNFKLFLLDVGLLSAMAGLPAEVLLAPNDIFTEFKGALAKQYAMQQMVSDTKFTPFFFKKTHANEIDFVVQFEMDIIPVEIKAGVNIKAKSLLAYCDKYSPRKAVRCSLRPYHEDEPITELPLYAICNLSKVLPSNGPVTIE